MSTIHVFARDKGRSVLWCFIFVCISFYTIPLYAGSVSSDNNQVAQEQESSLLQNLLERMIPMRDVQRHEEWERMAEEERRKEAEEREKYKNRVQKETLSESVENFINEGVFCPTLNTLIRATAAPVVTNFGYRLFIFINEDYRYQHIVELLSQTNSGDTEFMRAKGLLEDTVNRYIRACRETVNTGKISFEGYTQCVEMLPVLIFYFFEPYEGLPLLKDVFCSRLYADKIDHVIRDYSFFPEENEPDIQTINFERCDTSERAIKNSEKYVMAFIIYSYIEKMLVNVNEKDKQDFTLVFDKFNELHAFFYNNQTTIYIQKEKSLNNTIRIKIDIDFESKMFSLFQGEYISEAKELVEDITSIL